MSELDKILITSAATVLGGVTVFTVGQVLSKFFIEPIYEQRKLVGAVADALIYYAHHFADSLERTIPEVQPASDRFRRLAAELMARTVAVPGYRVWGRLRVIRPFPRVVEARASLIGLSNTLHSADFQRKLKLASSVATALAVREVDVGLNEAAVAFRR